MILYIGLNQRKNMCSYFEECRKMKEMNLIFETDV